MSFLSCEDNPRRFPWKFFAYSFFSFEIPAPLGRQSFLVAQKILLWRAALPWPPSAAQDVQRSIHSSAGDKKMSEILFLPSANTSVPPQWFRAWPKFNLGPTIYCQWRTCFLVCKMEILVPTSESYHGNRKWQRHWRTPSCCLAIIRAKWLQEPPIPWPAPFLFVSFYFSLTHQKVPVFTKFLKDQAEASANNTLNVFISIEDFHRDPKDWYKLGQFLFEVTGQIRVIAVLGKQSFCTQVAFYSAYGPDQLWHHRQLGLWKKLNWQLCQNWL